MAAEVREDFWEWYDLNELFVQPFRIAQQCEQARLSCPRAEWAARMKAQHLVDISRQRRDVDLTDLREIFLIVEPPRQK